MRKAFSFFMGVLMGSLIGGVVALLFAPESGVELRNLIRQRAEVFSTEIRQAAATKRIELQERLETMRAPQPK